MSKKFVDIGPHSVAIEGNIMHFRVVGTLTGDECAASLRYAELIINRHGHYFLDNLFAPEVVANPHPLFHALRQADPVHLNPMLGGWLITRYDDNVALLADARCSSDWASNYGWARALTFEEAKSLAFIKSYFSEWMQGMDNPRHTRQRSLFNKAFSARVVENMRQGTARHAKERLDALAGREQIELISEYSYPIASALIMELLGIPEEGCERVQNSSKTLFEFFTIMDPAPGQLERMAQSLRDVGEYLKTVIEARRQKPQDDLLSALVTAEVQGQVLSTDELTLACTTLLFAGHETTTNLVGNGILALLQHPAELARLRGGAVSIASAVDELLRFGSPVAIALRIAKEDISLRGKTIPAGQRIMTVLAAGNRDPQQFPDPDRLDLGRQNGRSLGFGYGSHFCLGAAMAKMATEILISAIFDRFPNLQLATPELSWQPQIFARALNKLPLRPGSSAQI